MKISIIGSGYVGLVSGTCFAEFGFDVTCVDKDIRKIELLKQGVMPIYEPGLEQLVLKNQAEKRLRFTTDLKEAVQNAEVIFIAVGTPTRRGGGHADLSYVFAAAEEIAGYMNGYKVIATKSTVPVGTGRKIFECVKKANPKAEFDVVSNPEFLREGSAIEDFMRPDRVVIGVESSRAETIMRELYRPLFLLETPIVATTLETSELIKYASNAFLATKIAFINEL
ncbi:MAG: UDP-glucose dehydrogenase family protein, partial [Candidatus Nucleicultricaceae bacterium]